MKSLGSKTGPDVEVLFVEAKALYPHGHAELEAIEKAHPLYPMVSGSTQKDETMRPPDQEAVASRLAKLRAFLHGRHGDDVPTALCLSGGGIRSATFGLGVVQGMAAQNLLPFFHYLSTVSGGGYLGSWLSAWIRNEGLRIKARDDVARQQKSGTSQKAPQPLDLKTFNEARRKVFEELGRVGHGLVQEPAPLRKLRAFSNYLSPMRGITADALTLLAIYARNLVLNWMVLIPCLVAALLAPRLHLAILGEAGIGGQFATALACIAWLLIAWTIAYMASDLPAAPEQPLPVGTRLDSRAPRRPPGVFLPLVLPLLTAAVLICWLIAWTAHGGLVLPALEWLLSPTEWLLGIPGWSSLADGDRRQLQGVLLAAFVGGATHAISSVIGGTVLRRYRTRESGTRPATLSAGVAVTCTGALTGMALYALIHGLAMKAPPGADADLRMLALLGVPSLLLVFWFGVTLYAGWRRPEGHEDEREWWARAAARWMGPSIIWLLGFAVVLYLPGMLLAWSGLTGENSSAALGVGTGALGAVVAAIGYLSKQGPAWRKSAETFAQKTGMRMLDLLAIGFIVLFLSGLSYGISNAMRLNGRWQASQDSAVRKKIDEPAADKAMCAALSAAGRDPLGPIGSPCNPVPCAEKSCAPWSERARERYESSLAAISPGPLAAWGVALLAVALLTSWRIGVNAFSLHGLYGNRLVRAYLAASRLATERRPHWFTGFDPKDNVPMCELWPQQPSPGEPAARFLHVVGIALNLVAPSGLRLEWQDRKAAAFTMSPLYSGSELTDYVRSDAYVANPHRQGVSLGSAMTISGAAAAPNMGYHSSVPLAFVMTLFNVRLGMWLPNPNWPRLAHEDSNWPWRRDEPYLGLRALWDEAMGNTSAESRFLNLSDGGHFDNMGLYEMVRRRCRRIVLVDSTADPDYVFDDLLSTLRKIRIDMGIVIDFEAGLPGPLQKHGNGQAVSEGVIRYGMADMGAPDGSIVLIKPTLLPDPSGGPRLPPDVLRYADETARGKDRFPQQSTSDQFFDEAQFESYRMLGLFTALHAFGKDDLSPHRPMPSTPPPGGAGGEEEPASKPAPAGEASAEGASAAVARGLQGQGLVAQMRSGIGMIATTAVVSAVTITGVVQLSDKTVKLDDPRVTISNPEIRILPPTPASGIGTIAGPDLDTARIEESLRRLATAADEGAEAAGGLAGGADAAAGAVGKFTGQADGAGKALDDFKVKLAAVLPKPGTTVKVELGEGVEAALKSTAVSASQAAAAASAAAQAASQSAKRMEGMASDLGKIRDSIAQTLPRSNARGSAEGTQR